MIFILEFDALEQIIKDKFQNSTDLIDGLRTNSSIDSLMAQRFWRYLGPLGGASVYPIVINQLLTLLFFYTSLLFIYIFSHVLGVSIDSVPSLKTRPLLISDSKL